MRNVGDGALVTDEVGSPSVREVLVEHAVETPRLVLVPVDAIFDVFWGVAREVVWFGCKRGSLVSTCWFWGVGVMIGRGPSGQVR